jgi:hypothetical protein
MGHCAMCVHSQSFLVVAVNERPVVHESPTPNPTNFKGNTLAAAGGGGGGGSRIF